MSGVLHPVGPESARTYWFRRAVVLAAMVLLLTAVIALTGAARGGRQQAVPETAAPPAPTATLTPSASSSSAPVATPLVPAESTTAVSPAASAPTSTAGPTADPTPAAVKACEGSALRTTLRGDQTLKPKDLNTFTLSLINGGPARCIIQVTPDNFELRIYSGSDRIWTTRHCSTLLKPIKETVRSEAAVEWQVKWNGRRSANACKNGPGVPGAGTYIATAQLDGAQPVQLRMVIAG